MGKVIRHPDLLDDEDRLKYEYAVMRANTVDDYLAAVSVLCSWDYLHTVKPEAYLTLLIYVRTGAERLIKMRK